MLLWLKTQKRKVSESEVEVDVGCFAHLWEDNWKGQME